MAIKKIGKRELVQFLSLAVQQKIKENKVDDRRLRKLRAYTFSITEALKEHVSDGLLTPEELELVLLAGVIYLGTKIKE